MQTCVQRFISLISIDKPNIEQFSDATLKTTDGHSFPVSKMLLSIRSDYFYKLFSVFDGKQKTEYPIRGISGDSLANVLVYLYKHQTYLTDKNIADVMVAAHYCQIDGLVKQVVKSVKDLISIENCVTILHHAHRIKITDIYNEAFRFIQSSFGAVVSSQKTHLANLDLEILENLLASKEMIYTHEMHMWSIIIEWVQKDYCKRLTFVPHLLNNLAGKEIVKNPVEEILSHSIVATNPHSKTHGVYKSGFRLDLFECVLKYSNLDLFVHYMPTKLHVVNKRVLGAHFSSEIYVTCNEKLDLWRKITELDFCPLHMVAIECSLYLFEYNYCHKLDLKNNQLTQIRPFDMHVMDVVKHKKLLYVFVRNREQNRCEIEIYDHGQSLWTKGTPCSYVDEGSAASISGCFYFIGKIHNSFGVNAQKYDTECDTWIKLPSPNDISSCLAFVVSSYKGKLLLMSQYEQRSDFIDFPKFEVFDPNSQQWSNPKILTPPNFNLTCATVLNDKLLICGGEETQQNLLWNDSKKIWEKSDEPNSLIDYFFCSFCDLDDPDSIRFILKGHQIGGLQRCDFKN